VTWRTRPEDPACLPHFQEALTLDQQIGDRQGEAEGAGSLGNAYLRVPGLRDLDQAEHWFQRSLSLRLDSDRLGRAQCLSPLGGVAIRRFDDGLVAGEAEPILLQYLNAARRHYLQSLDLTPAGDHEARANREHQLGVIYDRAGDTRQALLHYQQSIQHEEERGNIFGAGQTRFNIAHALADDGRVSDALHYARAALDNYQQAGPGAASDAEQARQFIADLEQRDR
jgi:tetratricopeptide (TPR) repeat protein